MDERPWVVCLCGSTKFKDAFIRENARLSLQGNIVLSVGLFAHSGDAITDEQKVLLDELHLRKIDMADEVRVINVGKYRGSSTIRETLYAYETGKVVSYLEPPV